MISMEPKVIIIGLIVFLVVAGGFVWLLNGNQGVKAPISDSTTAPSDDTTNVTKKNMKAKITTERGVIEFEPYPDAAPKTVKNFIEKADARYFDGLRFHRVEDWVIQGGDPLSRDESKKQLWGTGGGNIDTELSQLPFAVGAVGVARGGNIAVSNDSQFFIVKKDSQFLNSQYTLFGRVVGGMDVVLTTEQNDKINSIAIEK